LGAAIRADSGILEPLWRSAIAEASGIILHSLNRLERATP